MNTRTLSLRLLSLMAIGSFAVTSCYPELYEEKDTYLEEIKASQQGIGHGGEEHGEEHGGEHGDAGHGDEHSEAAHGDAGHGDEHSESHDEGHDKGHDEKAPADNHGGEGH